MAHLIPRSGRLIGAAFVLSGCLVGIDDVDDQPSSGGSSGSGAKEGGAGTGGAGGSTGGAGATDASTGGTQPGGTGGGVSCSACGSGNCLCVPKAPAGYRYVQIAASSAPTPCPEEYPNQSVVGTGAIDTGCSECKCGPATGVSCSVKVTFYNDAICAFSTVKPVIVENGCVAKGGPYAQSSVVATGGTCPASAAPNAPSFEKTVTLCASQYEPIECPTGVCVSAPASAFDASACVVADNPAISECPPAYPVKRVYATGFDDKRQCEGCTCTPTNLGCAGATGQLHPCEIGCALCTGGAGAGSTTCLPMKSGDLLVSGAASVGIGECAPAGAATTTGTVTTNGSRVACCVS